MKTVLLVEDDITLHDLYKEALAPLGITLSAVTTGKEGLESTLRNPPDLIILDVMLPGGLNGFDVAEQLKHNPKTAAIPLLFLTNLDSEKQSAQAVNAQYLVKSNTSLEQVVHEIKSLLHI